MRSWASPKRSAISAERSALSRIASSTTARSSSGAARRAFSSIRRVSSARSSEPQLTPIRTGFPCSAATSIMRRKFSSCFSPTPTLPGLIRYLSSALAQSGNSVSSRWPL